jgi:hypothetical protein
VNLYPFTVDVEFNFVQVPPAFATAALAGTIGIRASKIATASDFSKFLIGIK